MLQYTYRSERTCYAKEKFFTYFKAMKTVKPKIWAFFLWEAMPVWPSAPF